MLRGRRSGGGEGRGRVAGGGDVGVEGGGGLWGGFGG